MANKRTILIIGASRTRPRLPGMLVKQFCKPRLAYHRDCAPQVAGARRPEGALSWQSLKRKP